MNRGYVYRITNNINGKWYIGSRRADPTNDTYMGSGVALANAKKKYGIENFKKEILCVLPAEDCYKFEESLLETLDAANDKQSYNMKNAGKGGMKGYIASEETKCKLKNSLTGLKRTEKTKLNISLSKLGNNNPNYGKEMPVKTKEALIKANTGRTLSPEAKEKISLGNTGNKNWLNKHHTKESKLKMSEIAKARGISKENRIKMIKSRKEKYIKTHHNKYDHTIRKFCHEFHGLFIGTRNELQEKYNLTSSNLSKIICGTRLSHNGWVYLGVDENDNN